MRRLFGAKRWTAGSLRGVTRACFGIGGFSLTKKLFEGSGMIGNAPLFSKFSHALALCGALPLMTSDVTARSFIFFLLCRLSMLSVGLRSAAFARM